MVLTGDGSISDERAAAISTGFQSAFRDNNSFPEAIGVGTRSVMAL